MLEYVPASTPTIMAHAKSRITPVPITATPLEQVDEATSPLTTWTRSANYVGGCAISLPAGFSPDNLPVGVQLISRRYREDLCLAAAEAIERRSGFGKPVDPFVS